MNSFLMPQFLVLYRALPEEVRQQARQAEGRVRGGTGRGADSPHPPLRGTFSRREKGFCPSPAGRGWPKAG